MVVPTAQISDAVSTEMAARVFPDGAKLGLGTIFQVAPFQCSIRVSCILALSFSPTAQILLAAIAAIPERDPAILGLETTVHRDLLRCSIKGELALPLLYDPTAQILPGATAATPLRKFVSVPGFGLDATVHFPHALCV